MASQINPGSMIAIASAVPAVCIVAVSARFYIRITHNHGLKVDDWLILPALIMVIGIGIGIIIGVKQRVMGYSKEQAGFTSLVWPLAFVQQIEFAVYIMSQLALCLSKLSLLYFYRRIFYTGSKKAFNIFTKVLAAIIVLWSVAEIIEFIFHCGSQVYLQWGSYLDIEAKCANGAATNLFLISFDVLLDLILFVIPLPFLLKLQLSKSRRFGLVIVFAVGALAVIASIIRLVIFVLVFDNSTVYSFTGHDILIILSLFFYWTMFETGVGVLVTCLPVLQIWFRKASVETVRRNILGIFSVTSLSRSSQKSGGSKYHRGSSDRANAENGHGSSLDDLHHLSKPTELDKLSQSSAHHEEN